MHFQRRANGFIAPGGGFRTLISLQQSAGMQ
jgi:hypothetical protein